MAPTPYFVQLYISTPCLRIVIITDDGVIPLLLLTLYDFYFMLNDRAGYIDKGFAYVLTLYTNEITSTSSPICYENDSKSNF